MLRTLTTLACIVPALALGQSLGGPLRGQSLVVNDGPGDQTDPHVSGALVAYTQQLSVSSSEIRYHDLVSGVDQAIPTEGGYDALADINGDQIVFTRTTSTTRVLRFDAHQGGFAEELAPRPGANRRTAAVGGPTVAWQELGYTAQSLPAEIFAYRQDTLALTRLTEDSSVDRSPAVSADGRTVVWTKCATNVDGCDVWSARATEGGYEVSQLTGSEGEESLPDTNGDVAVYVTRSVVNGVSESDIAWQPVGGGEVHRLSLPGTDTNPSVSGPLIAFERWDATSATPNFDLMLYDLRTQTYYRLTDTPGSESLSDLSVDSTGTARVVWTARQNGNLNVYAFVFSLPSVCTPPPPQTAAEVCASPGDRPLLGSLLVSRSTGEPEVVSTPVEGRGSGVLCVDNGFEGTPATSGWVWLGAGLQVGPYELGHDVTSVARKVPLQGQTLLSAQVEGAPGSAFQVRLYGEVTCDAGPAVGPEVHEGQYLPAESMGQGFNSVSLAHYFVPSGYEGQLVSGGDPVPGSDPETGSGSETGSGPDMGGTGQVQPPAEGSGADPDGMPGVVPEAGPELARAGCSAGSGPVSFLGVWVLVASVLLRDRAARARVRAASRR